MAAPDAFVREAHALFALAGRLDEGTINMQVRAIEEALGLLMPDTLSCLVKRFHQQSDVGLREPPAEVARRRRVRQRRGTNRVQKYVVAPPQFDVVQTLTVTQRVVRQVEPATTGHRRRNTHFPVYPDTGPRGYLR
ncbi:MAG: hypothetical protein ISQ06_12735, partial [Planctomycetaceae bacterium]|nr:hypothetical protein [Planctomycetaceae bacterium]